MLTPARVQAPEIVRTPLAQLCLQVRALGGLALPGAGGVEGFLQKAVTPPATRAVSNALGLLRVVGALTEDEALTALGTQLALLPLVSAATALPASARRCVSKVLISVMIRC